MLARLSIPVGVVRAERYFVLTEFLELHAGPFWLAMVV